MAEINLKRAFQTIRIGGEDAPAFELDLRDMGINEKTVAIRKALDGFDKGAMGAVETAEAYHGVIDAMLGEGAYAEVVDYVGGGHAKGSELNSIITPLVLFLLETYNDVMSANNNELVRNYASGHGATVL